MSPRPASSSGPQRIRIPVGILGATGAVGQRFLTLLAAHPWFEPVALFASERSAGRPYSRVVRWHQEGGIPPSCAGLEVRPIGDRPECLLLFSALDADVAGGAEHDLAAAGHFVVSNAKSHRMDAHVPLVVPEVNPGHLDLVLGQGFGGGAIVTNPNCATIGLVLALKPLVDAFGVRRVRVVTLQALSGAGIPGVPGLVAVDNVVPFIAGEEEKIETETGKILGTLTEGRIVPARTEVSAQCNRVPVIDGHLLSVSIELEQRASPAQVESTLRDFRGEPQRRELPSAPAEPIEIADSPDRPQPRLDRGRGRGMAITIGRIRPSPGGIQFVALSHNTIRGAAGGSILLAELAVARGLVPAITVPDAITKASPV